MAKLVSGPRGSRSSFWFALLLASVAVPAAAQAPATPQAPTAPAVTVTDATTAPTVTTAPPPAVKGEDAATAVLAVAVLDFQSAGDIAGAAKALTTLVTNEVGGHRGFRAVSRNDLRAVIAHQSTTQLLGCNEPRCAADIAKLADADRVIAGSLERAEGGAVVLSLTFIDPEGPTVLDRLAYTWHSAPDDMLELARPAVERLLLGAKASSFVGDLEVLVRDGASVVVDGTVVGDAPVAPVRGLATGVHSVEVRQGGYVPFKTDVAISHGETRVLQVDLIDEASLQPWFSRWYVWGSALAGVVVVGGTVAAVGTYQYLNTPSRLVVGGPAK